KQKISTTHFNLSRIRSSLMKKKKQVIPNSTITHEQLRKSMEQGYRKQLKKAIDGMLNFFKIGNSLKVWYVKM
ncbi:MAG: hypothetical protein ABI207_07625, partial [Crocinitomicaceae bacterium]